MDLYKLTYTRDNAKVVDIVETLADVSAVLRSLVYNTDRSRKTGNRFGSVETIDSDLCIHHGDGFWTLKASPLVRPTLAEMKAEKAKAEEALRQQAQADNDMLVDVIRTVWDEE